MFNLEIIITHPQQWPNTANFVPSPSTSSIVIKPSYSYTTPAVHGLMEAERQCVYEVFIRATILIFSVHISVAFLARNG